MKPSILLTLFLLAAAQLPVWAQQPATAQSRNAQSQERPVIGRILDDRVASDWGLQPQEWARYRELMEGPLGIYSPNLDPLSALGVEARSDEERRRYAEMQVKAEARRVEKLLAYQRAYDEAWQRLNPGMQRVNLPDDLPTAAGVRGSSRTAVFVRTAARPAGNSCSACNPRAPSSTSTWSAAARTMRASATGPSARTSIRRACAPAASRSTTTAAAGCRWACPAICPPPCAK